MPSPSPLDVPDLGPAVVRFAASASEGPTLADLKALALGHLEGGTHALVLDLRDAGPLDRRIIGTLMYVLAFYHEAGGRLTLRVSPEQRASLTPYARLFQFAEDGAVDGHPPASQPPRPPSSPAATPS